MRDEADHSIRVERFPLHPSSPIPHFEGGRKMKIIVTGSTGLVGTALVRSLLAEGHQVTRMVRGGSQTFRAPGTSAVSWDPEKGTVNAAELEGHDAAVHLAGEPIVGRWTDEKKRRILESRVKSTRLLAETLAGLKDKPKVLV